MSDMSTRPRKPKHLKDRSALLLKLNLRSKIIILSQQKGSSLAKHSLKESVWCKLIGSAKFPATACCSPCVHKQILRQQAPKRSTCTQFRWPCWPASKPAAPRWRMQLLEAAGPRTTGLEKSNVNRTSSKLTVHYETLWGVSIQHSFFRFFGASDLTLQDFDGQPLEGSDRGPFHRMVLLLFVLARSWSRKWFLFVWAITTTDFAWFFQLWYVFYLLLMGHAAQTWKK